MKIEPVAITLLKDIVLGIAQAEKYENQGMVPSGEARKSLYVFVTQKLMDDIGLWLIGVPSYAKDPEVTFGLFRPECVGDGGIGRSLDATILRWGNYEVGLMKSDRESLYNFQELSFVVSEGYGSGINITGVYVSKLRLHGIEF